MFKAQNAPIVVFIYRKNRESYEMTRFDLSDETFTRGQWLLHKQLFVPGCSISPCGNYFYWVYNEYQKVVDSSAGISKVPFFTAILFGHGVGRWDICRFNKGSHRPIDKFSLVLKKDDCVLPPTLQPIPKCEGKKYAELNPGLISEGKLFFNDILYEIEGTKVLKSGGEIYDFIDHEFQEMSSNESELFIL